MNQKVTLVNKVHSFEIRNSLNIEPFLLRIEISQLRWFGHVSRMPQERPPKQALLAKANGRRPVRRPRTRSTNYIKNFGWNCLRFYPSEMMDAIEDREVWRLNFELLSRNSHGKAGNKGRRNKKQTNEEKEKCIGNKKFAFVAKVFCGHAYSNDLIGHIPILEQVNRDKKVTWLDETNILLQVKPYIPVKREEKKTKLSVSS